MAKRKSEEVEKNGGRYMELDMTKIREVLEVLSPLVRMKSVLESTKYVRVGNGCAVITDLDTAIKIDLPGATEPMLLPGHRTLELLQYVAAMKVKFTANDDGTIAIEAGRTATTLRSLPVEDFPPVSMMKEGEGNKAVVNGDALVAALTTVLPYASTDESRPVLTSIHIETGERPAAVAADGFRLAWERLPAMLEGQSMNIRPSAVRLLARLWKWGAAAEMGPDLELLALAKRPIRIQWNADYLQLAFGRVTIVTKQIEGTFPNYRQLIPDQFKSNLTVHAGELLRAIRQVDVVVQDGSSIVRLEWAKGVLVITAKGEEERMSTSITAKMDNPGRIAMSAGYLMGYLHGKDGLVTLRCNDPSAAACFSYRGVDHAMVMPMFVHWDDENGKTPSEAKGESEDEGDGNSDVD